MKKFQATIDSLNGPQGTATGAAQLTGEIARLEQENAKLVEENAQLRAERDAAVTKHRRLRTDYDSMAAKLKALEVAPEGPQGPDED